MKHILIFFFFISFTGVVNAQFLVKGKIEFERKINVHKQFENDGEWFQEVKKQIPQFNITYFDYYFAADKSIYKPGRENADNSRNMWGQAPAAANVVYSDFATGQFASQKQVFEENFLVQDSFAKIQWKLTPDTRKIAGFDCRKAVAIIMDSVYVIAFYTDEIMISGGPESFNGLPGMILGLAIPRMHTTWFATKLELIEVKDSDLKIPTKGKKTTITDLQKNLQKSLKDWGKWAARNIWFTMI